ncbi:MAG: heme o synthase [Verrucomicrobiota bacterium]|nr:heme o synthase [Verrucomicrobiota bacterium]
MKTAAVDPTALAKTRSRVVSDFAELIKARLTLLVLLTTAVGYYLGARPGSFDPLGLLHAFVGTALAAAGAAALNQWWERRLDALMHRTRERPIPSGRMAARDAIFLGVILSLGGIAYLAFACNSLAAILAALTIVLYIFAYTPLKRISTGNTLVGAIPGAIPPVIGWVAARGELGPGAWSLFAILFFWQMPHFFALSWMYRGDYARAGFRMVSNDDDSGARSSSQSVLFCILLLIVSGGPTWVGLTSAVYLGFALILDIFFIAAALRFHQRRTVKDARNVFLASIIYLPLLLLALVFTKL